MGTLKIHVIGLCLCLEVLYMCYASEGSSKSEPEKDMKRCKSCS